MTQYVPLLMNRLRKCGVYTQVILFIPEERWNFVIWRWMDETEKHYLELIYPSSDSKGYKL
jgi:hypothetical protein